MSGRVTESQDLNNKVSELNPSATIIMIAKTTNARASLPSLMFLDVSPWDTFLRISGFLRQ